MPRYASFVVNPQPPTPLPRRAPRPRSDKILRTVQYPNRRFAPLRARRRSVRLQIEAGAGASLCFMKAPIRAPPRPANPCLFTAQSKAKTPTFSGTTLRPSRTAHSVAAVHHSALRRLQSERDRLRATRSELHISAAPSPAFRTRSSRGDPPLSHACAMRGAELRRHRSDRRVISIITKKVIHSPYLSVPLHHLLTRRWRPLVWPVFFLRRCIVPYRLAEMRQKWLPEMVQN